MGTFFYGELARHGLAKAIFVLIHTFLQSDSFFEIGFCYPLVKIPDRKQSILAVHYLDCRAQSSLQQFSNSHGRFCTEPTWRSPFRSCRYAFTCP